MVKPEKENISADISFLIRLTQNVIKCTCIAIPFLIKTFIMFLCLEVVFPNNRAGPSRGKGLPAFPLAIRSRGTG
jgi:hypothetical protein